MFISKFSKKVSSDKPSDWFARIIAALALCASVMTVYSVHLKPANIHTSVGNLHFFTAKKISQSNEGLGMVLVFEIVNNGSKTGIIQDIVVTLTGDSGDTYLFEPYVVIDYPEFMRVIAENLPFHLCVKNVFSPFTIGGSQQLIQYVYFGQNRVDTHFCMKNITPGNYSIRVHVRSNNKWQIVMDTRETFTNEAINTMENGTVVARINRTISRERTKAKLFP